MNPLSVYAGRPGGFSELSGLKPDPSALFICNLLMLSQRVGGTGVRVSQGLMAEQDLARRYHFIFFSCFCFAF